MATLQEKAVAEIERRLENARLKAQGLPPKRPEDIRWAALTRIDLLALSKGASLDELYSD